MIVGFNGSKGSGKSTASKFLEDNGFLKVSFAAPLKEMTAKVFKKSLSIFSDPDKKDKRLFPNSIVTSEQANNIVREGRRLWSFDDYASERIKMKLTGFYYDTPRQLLQFIGDDCFRQCVDSNFWVNVIKKKLRPNVKYVIEDVRYDNEVEYILNSSGIVVKIVRDGLPNDGHSSERGISKYSVIINNNSSLEDFDSNIKVILNDVATSTASKQRDDSSI